LQATASKAGGRMHGLDAAIEAGLPLRLSLVVTQTNNGDLKAMQPSPTTP
jgi:hypothetical protein